MCYIRITDDFGDHLFPCNNHEEILRLENMLELEGIPHALLRRMDGAQVLYPSIDDIVCSAVEFSGTYGAEYDKIEIMGLLTDEERVNDSVRGWLTADDVFARIKAHYDAIASL